MNATQKSLKNPGKIVKGDNRDYYLTDGRGFIWIIHKDIESWLAEMNLNKYKHNTRKQLVETILSRYPIY